MVEGFALFLLFQLAGEGLSRGLGLPVPGPVVGLMLLFAGVRLLPALGKACTEPARALHGHFSLLFVPAGTGVMLYFPVLVHQWLPIVVALVSSTLVGLAVTAWVTATLMRRQARREHG